eukprot:TRINITY_DN5158_c0_g3_i1.p1 TRINITY_DN5158_c0_g3~~TRINITY_DN5158_c0_g3_i1.p1  ORF type:complete len:388 (+),score=92.66 TRINITY_DN5158_c0_g3_i1:73-1236(+)
MKLLSIGAVAAAVFPTFTDAGKFRTEMNQQASSDAAAAAYEEFRSQQGRSEAMDTSEYTMRLNLFKKRQAEVHAHNSRSDVSWKAEVNKFADYTDQEFNRLLGFRRLGRWWQKKQEDSFLEIKDSDSKPIADNLDFRVSLSSSKFVRDQGQCGSCWAVAAAGTLEMRAEFSNKKTAPPLSFKQLVDCTPNTQHCGGEGGCSGATPELAFEYVAQNGIAAANSYYGNIAKTDTCQNNTYSKTPVLQTGGFVKLPVNRLQPLLAALQDGPVTVSVDASNWGMYHHGIFHGCVQDATINHAVVAAGYGKDASLGGKKYFLIRNSWGSSWGEGGFIRMLRHDSDTGDAGYCGTDFDPKQGSGCDGGPKTLPVCGMCGVLSDSSYPTFVKFA